MAPIVWLILYGPYNMAHNIWPLHYEPYFMAPIIRPILYGPCNMGVHECMQCKHILYGM